MTKIIKEFTCDCGGNCFTLQMRYKKEDEMNLLLCHDGYGFLWEDATWICNKCKKEKLGGEGEWKDKKDEVKQ